MLEVTRDTDVYTARDEHVGSVDRVVLDPLTRRMSHVVVRKGIFFPEDKLIAVEDISTAAPERVNLRQDVDVAELRPFIEQHYIEVDDADQPVSREERYTAFAATWYGPVGVAAPVPEATLVAVNERAIPERLAAVEMGVPVFVEGREEIGRLERVVVDDAGYPTHIVVSSTGPLPERRAVPIAWVEDIAEEVILLGVRRRMVDAIPPLGPDD